MTKIIRTASTAIVFGFAIGSCKSDPLVFPDPSGSGGSSSSSGDASSSSAQSSSTSSNSSTSVSSSSSSGQGNGGSDPGLPCDPCENVDGARLVRQRSKTVGDDGLVFYQGISSIYDTAKQLVCVAMPAEDGIVRCMPPSYTTATVGLYFADAACTAPLAYATAATCNPIVPKFAGELVSGSSCNESGKFVLYATGSEYSGSLYFKSNNVCMSTTSLPNYKYYSLGNKISPSEFVQLTVQTIP
jgi:hypothetical protein